MKTYEKLNKYIKDKGLKQVFIAKKTGIPENTLSMILNGKCNLSADNFVDIIIALEIDPNEIIFRYNETTTETSDTN